MNFRAPAKLILSGEHAVVHGAPALAMAVNSYVTAEVTALPYALTTLSIPAFDYKRSLDANAVNELSETIQERYKLYQQNKYSIDQVLQHPSELVVYAMSVVMANYRIAKGMSLKLATDIPIGCGMGSSAAAIVTTMFAVTSLAGFNLSPTELYPLALTAENMQHGHSSGMDIQLALHGGCLYRQGAVLTPRNIPHFPLYVVHTGAPVVTTGQCVSAVRAYFNGEKDNLIDRFSEVTHRMDRACQTSSYQQMFDAIQENHRLLVRVGVVPDKVQNFISELEEKGAAAKVCGAGAIKGDQGGAVVVLTTHPAMLASLCEKYSYYNAPVIGARRGVHEF